MYLAERRFPPERMFHLERIATQHSARKSSPFATHQLFSSNSHLSFNVAVIGTSMSLQSPCVDGIIFNLVLREVMESLRGGVWWAFIRSLGM